MRHQDRDISRTREREREIEHIAIGTYPQPEGGLLPPHHGLYQDDEDGHRRWIPLSGRVLERLQIGFSLIQRVAAVERRVYGYIWGFLNIWEFIGIGGSGGGPRGAQHPPGCARGPLALPCGC